MATYMVIGRNGGGSPVVSVSITSIDQEQQVIAEIDVVDAVRDRLLATPGVASVLARRYEQVITDV